MNDLTKERADFEAWWNENGLGPMDEQWSAWQARAALSTPAVPAGYAQTLGHVRQALCWGLKSARRERVEAISQAIKDLDFLLAAAPQQPGPAVQGEAQADRMADALHRLRDWSEAYPLEAFPEMLREEWQRANEVLAQAGINMSRMSASNMRHVITQVRKIIDAAMHAQGGEK